MAQTVRDIKSVEQAYVSASVAFDQKVLQKAKDSAPTIQAPQMDNASKSCKSWVALPIILLASKEIIQNIIITVKELAITELILIQKATFSGLLPARKENILPTKRNKGAPGGCVTCNL
jgi:hypothetical protein